MNRIYRPSFQARYSEAIQLFEKAHMRCDEGDADDTLTAARKSLEFFAKSFCSYCGMPLADLHTERAYSIEELINNLTVSGYINQNGSAMLHRLRQLGNVGSHQMANMNQAYEAIELLDSTLDLFAELDANVFCEEDFGYVYDLSELSPIQRLCAQRPIFYRVLCCVVQLPLIAATSLTFGCLEKSLGVFFVILAMAASVFCLALHNKLTAFIDVIPVPEEGYCKRELKLTRILGVVALVMFAVFLVFIIGSHPSIIAKILAVATLVLCCRINPTLWRMSCKLRGKKA